MDLNQTRNTLGIGSFYEKSKGKCIGQTNFSKEKSRKIIWKKPRTSNLKKMSSNIALVSVRKI